jgi:hypothetical protein
LPHIGSMRARMAVTRGTLPRGMVSAMRAGFDDLD